MVMEVPLIWKLQVDGADRIKSVMNDLNSAFQRGQISSSEYADSMTKIGRESNRVNNISRTQNQIFLAMHPNINKLSRGFSMFASVARTTLSLMTSINTLMIAQNTQSSALSEITSSLAENRREFNRTVDPERLQQLNEEYATLLAREKEIKDQDNVTYWEQWLNVILGAGLYLNIFKNHLGKIVPFLTNVKAIGGVGLFAALAIGIAYAAEELYKFIFGIEDMDKWRAENQKALVEFFTIAIPTAIGQAGVFLSNFFLNDLPTWAKSGWETVSTVFVTTWNNLMGFIETGINMALQGFASFVNAIISGINSIISGINKAFKSNIPAIQPFVIQNISLPKIKTEVAQPAGSPAKGQIGPSNTYITVQGSVITERQLMNMVDDKFKGYLKDRGFTGFQ